LQKLYDKLPMMPLLPIINRNYIAYFIYTLFAIHCFYQGFDLITLMIIYANVYVARQRTLKLEKRVHYLFDKSLKEEKEKNEKAEIKEKIFYNPL